MKNFKEYLFQKEKENSIKLKIKTAVELTKENYDTIFNLLYYKYGLRDISTPKKLVFQSRPLDFTDIDNTEIYVIDVELRYPVSAYVLEQELSEILNISRKFIVVRNENDTYENQMEEKNKNENPLLSTNSNYKEEETVLSGDFMYGNKYNERFKEMLKNNENSSIDYFSYKNDFNKNIKDSPRIHYGKKRDSFSKTEKDYSEKIRSRWGNFWKNNF
jgi:hypothetical protein